MSKTGSKVDFKLNNLMLNQNFYGLTFGLNHNLK